MPPERVVTVLHLADFNLGRAPEGTREPVRLLDTLRRELDDRRDADGLSPDILVLSGNLSEHGRRDELESALEIVRGLMRIVDLPARRVVVVPGNHDINWNKSVAYFAECAAEDVVPAKPYFPKLSFYKQLVDRLYEGEPDLSFTEDEPWTFFAYPELGLVVAGLDSVIAESHRDEDHHPYLGERQMRAFVEKLRPCKEQGFLRLGVMHHDPAAPPAPGLEQDAADFARILRPWLNLVLHGDLRGEGLRWLSAEVPSFGVGTAAAGEHQWLQMHGGGVRWGRRAAAIEEVPVAFVDLYGHLDWLSKVGRPRRARVRFHNRDVGTLEETTTLGGPTRFAYSPGYLATPGARPIAPNLKLRTEPYESDTLHPFFANLLPEGAIYARTARRLGLKRGDRFGMLLRVGADVMGAVEVLPAEPS